LKNEIGGYFELEQLVCHEHYSNLIRLNTARNALLYLLKARTIKKIYLPYLLCDSISGICRQAGCAYEYYHIGCDFLPVFETTLHKGEFLYVINYYGQISNPMVLELKRRNGNIILDNVQAFFQPPLPNVDTIYSCRKFFGVPDGAYLSTTARIADQLPVDRSKNRMKHLLGRLEGNASQYYEDFKAAEGSFAELELRYMSKLTRTIMGAIDYENVIERRNENYTQLAEALEAKNRLTVLPPNGAFAYPFYCENGMQVRKRLAEKNIYIATLWPNVLDLDGTVEKDYAKNILPLPCDQRYGTEEMKHMLKGLYMAMG